MEQLFWVQVKYIKHYYNKNSSSKKRRNCAKLKVSCITSFIYMHYQKLRYFLLFLVLPFLDFRIYLCLYTSMETRIWFVAKERLKRL